MTKLTTVVTYVTYVALFSILFRYGMDISFKIDTGFIGPIYIFHSVLMLLVLTGHNKK